MKRILLIIAHSIVPAVTYAQGMATVELPGSTLISGDGFRARIEASATTEKTPRGRLYYVCTFDVYIPRHVGKTNVGSAFLELTGRDGRALSEVAMEDRSGRGQPPQFYIFADRRTAADCVLHFQYTEPLLGAIIKEYIIRLKYHIPAER